MYQFMHFLHGIQGYTLMRTDNKLTILSVAGVQAHFVRMHMLKML
jgi:hypothetical protein